jgi:hypothetical protein
MRARAAVAVVVLALVGACSIDHDPFEPTPDAPPAGMIVTSTQSVFVTETMSATFAISLSAPPSGNSVSVNIASADVTAAGVSPQDIFFGNANFATPQVVTVTGIADVDTAGDQTVIDVTAASYEARQVAVTVTDPDIVEIRTVPAQTGTGYEGAVATLQVFLTAQPTGAVVVSLASSDTGAMTVSPATLVYDAADWSFSKVANINGVEDADTLNESAMLTLTATNSPTVSVAYTINDND